MLIATLYSSNPIDNNVVQQFVSNLEILDNKKEIQPIILKKIAN